MIDGGNANYKDSIVRRNNFEKKKIGYVSAGVSGGITAIKNGPPITLDCSKKDLKKILPILKSFGGNFTYFEKKGKGHLAKTLHNAIEYGMMQSLAEGIALYLKHGFTEKEILRTFKTWAQGSIIESRLVNVVNQILEKYSLRDSQQIKKSETLKIVKEVLRIDCKTPILKESIKLRSNTKKLDKVVHTVLARQRLIFGGHSLREKK